jgi:hypothetical protein
MLLIIRWALLLFLVTAGVSCGLGGELYDDITEIAGRIQTEDGAAVEGITVNVSFTTATGLYNYTAVTNSLGKYSFSIPVSFSGTTTFTIIPERTRASDGAHFLFNSRSVSLRQGSRAVDQDFIAEPAVVVSGRITAAGVGINQIRIDLAQGDPVYTANSGDFSLFYRKNTSRTVVMTPSADYLISPASRTVFLNDADIDGQDFTASCRDGFLISGRILSSGGSPYPNVGIRNSGPHPFTARTNSDGEFISGCLMAGEYLISPDMMDGFSISPPSLLVTVEAGDVPNQDFIVDYPPPGLIDATQFGISR